MDPELLQLILALANPKGANTKSDYGRLFDPMLGVLTGTATEPPEDEGISAADLLYQYAPTLQQIKDSPYYDDTSLERRIASDLLAGTPPMIVKRDLRAVLAAQGIVADDQTTNEYENLVDKLAGEIHSLNVADSRQARAASKSASKTLFGKALLPEPDATYDTTDVLRSAYEKLAKEYGTAAAGPKGDSSGGEVGEARRMLTRSRAAAGANPTVRVGEVPNYVADFLKNPLNPGSIGKNLRQDLIENTAFLSLLGKPPGEGKRRQRARIAKEIPDAQFEEPNRVISELENRQRAAAEFQNRRSQMMAERAVQVAEEMKNIVARRNAAQSSPLLDALATRVMFLKLTGG
jgi:hypothetical protein